MFTVKEILKATEGKLISPLSKIDKGIVTRISIDSRIIQKGDLFLAIKGDRFNGHSFLKEAVSEGARVILVENEDFIQDRPKEVIIILVKDTKLALANLAHYARKKINPTVIAVTGSNGKTTTKDIIHHLLSTRHRTAKNSGTMNNHIGLSLSLLNMDENSEFAVVELGTNHFGEIANLAKIAEPDVAVFTNIGSAHLEYFQNQENVFKEKISLLDHLGHDKTIFVNADDRYLSQLEYKKKVTFGMSDSAEFFASDIKFAGAGYEFLLNRKYRLRLNCLGIHNIYNALAAIAVAKHFGIDFKTIRKALGDFRLPKMRLEYIRANGIELINDAYNSNPDSLKAAVDTLVNLPSNKRKVVVTADMLELGKESEHLHKDAGKYIGSRKEIDLLIGVGNFSGNVANGARERGMAEDRVKSFPSLDNSLADIISLIRPDDLLLVKGSRLMQMERLVEKLKADFK